MIQTFSFGSITWVDVLQPTQDEINQITNQYGIDPIIAHDLISPTPRTKTETNNTHVSTVLHFPAQKHSHIEQRQEIDIVVSKNAVITVHYESIDALEKLSKELEVENIVHKKKQTSAPGVLVALILRTLYRSVWDELAFAEDSLGNIEKHIFDGKEKEMVPAISEMSRQLIDFRKTLEFHDDALVALQETGSEVVGEKFGFTIAPAILEQQKLKDAIANHIELLAELRETNNSLLFTKQNEIMKVLTIMAFVTFPLSLLASIFGMNTHEIPIVGWPHDFWIIIGIMLVATIGMFFFFRHKKWL